MSADILCWAQPEGPRVALVPGPASVPVTGIYTLAFRLRGEALAEYSDFPDLEGFKKAGKTSTTTTQLVAGQRFTELTLTQRYAPYGEGDYAIKPFQLTVNGVRVRGGGTTVHVGPAVVAVPPAKAPAADAAPLQGVGALDQLFGKPKPALYFDVPDRGALALEADRRQVFVGEGVRVALSFYLRPADQAVLAFHDFDDQLPRLIGQLRQTTAWEVPAAEQRVLPDTVRRGGELLLRFRLAETTYYPLTAQPLRFPPLALTMTKFRLLKKPEPGVDGRLAQYKTYLAPALVVAVRPLPARRGGGPPAAVGHYQLRESISRTEFAAGQAFGYTFGVEGRGNLGALPPPVLAPRPGLAVYGPEVRDEALPGGGGRKLFRYRLVAQRPGPLPLDSLFQLAVFDPTTGRYDTLRSALRLQIRAGASAPAGPPVAADAAPSDPFYGPAIARADAVWQPLDAYRQARRYAGALLVGLLGLATAGWWQARRRAN
ncbi:BatD family protein [Hymenobacter nivis]|uniref:BatD family protein n=1 Tax=Hymenobacter nivis TaxID=1850093 RepID=UPI00137552A1|nr:BatD family protein [Hymenobacter nivis]